MRIKAESRTLAKVLSPLPAPKHYLTQFITVEKSTCKQGISAIFWYGCQFYPGRAKLFLPCNWGS